MRVLANVLTYSLLKRGVCLGHERLVPGQRGHHLLLHFPLHVVQLLFGQTGRRAVHGHLREAAEISALDHLLQLLVLLLQNKTCVQKMYANL